MDRSTRWGTDPFTTTRDASGSRGLYGSYNYASSQPQYHDPHSTTMQRSWNDQIPARTPMYSGEPSPGMYSDSAVPSQVASLQYDLNQATAQRDELQHYVAKLTTALKKSEAENEAHRKAREETNVMFSYLQDNAEIKRAGSSTEVSEQMIEDLENANFDRQELRTRVHALQQELSSQRQAQESLQEKLQASTLECDALRRRVRDFEEHGAQREVQMVEHKHLIETLRKQREELLQQVETLSATAQGREELNAAISVMAQNPNNKQVQKLQLQLDAAKKEAKSAHAQLIKLRAELEELRGGGSVNGHDDGVIDIMDSTPLRARSGPHLAPVAAAPPPPAPEEDLVPPEMLATITPREATREEDAPMEEAGVEAAPAEEPMVRQVQAPPEAHAARAAPAPAPAPASAHEPEHAASVPTPPPLFSSVQHHVVEKLVEKEVVVEREKIVTKNIYIEPQLPRAPYISQRALNPLQLSLLGPIAITPPQPAPNTAPKPAAAAAAPKPTVPPEQLKAAVDLVAANQARVEKLRLKIQTAAKPQQQAPAVPDSVTVTVHEAINLPKMDFFGSIDPFCKVKVGSKEQSTSVIKRKRNPTFEENFTFKDLQGASSVIVTLYDWERLHDSRPIGAVSFTLTELQQASVSKREIQLSSVQAGKGLVVGKGNKPSLLKLSAHYTRGTPAAASSADTSAQDKAELELAWNEYKKAEAEYAALVAKAGPGAAVPQPPAPAEIKVAEGERGPWTLKLQLVRGDHLPQMDVGGKADPYVILKLGKQEFKSRTIKNTLNPQWDQEFLFEITDETASIELTLMDWDRMSKDDLIGHVHLPVANFSGKPHAGSFAVTKPNSNKRLVGQDGEEAQVTLVLTPSNAAEVRVEPQAGAAGGSVAAQGAAQGGAGAPPVRMIRHSVQADPSTPVTLSIKLDRKLEIEANTPEKKEEWSRNFRRSVAHALGCSEERLFVLNLQPGSIIVDLSILPAPEDPTAAPPQKLASDFMNQMVTPGSSILKAEMAQGLVSCTVLDRMGQLEAENQFLMDHNSILQQIVKLSKITSNEKAKSIAKRLLLRGVHICWNKWLDFVDQAAIERDKAKLEEQLEAVKKEKDGMLEHTDRTVGVLREEFDKQREAAEQEKEELREEAKKHHDLQEELLRQKHDLERQMLARINQLQAGGAGPKLKVVCKSAANLPKVDTFGLIDAYCICRVGADDAKGTDHHKTKIIKKELNPTWDEEMIFSVNDPTDKFVLTLLDWERINDDRPIGYVEVPIEAIAGKKEGPKEYGLMKADRTGPLNGQEGRPSTIWLDLDFQPGESRAEMEELAELERKLEEERELEKEARQRLVAAQGEVWCRPPFNLKVNIIGCMHLPKTDTFGKCDPYCVVKIGSEERKTNRIEKTYDPVFNEELQFQVKKPQNLSISVWDWDRGKKDELVGTVDVPVGKLKPEEQEKSFPLLAPGKDKHLVGHDGQEAILRLSLMPLVDPANEENPSLSRELSKNSSHDGDEGKPWKLSVYGLIVDHLPKTDMIGKCDPYIMIAVGENRVQTKPVKKVYRADWPDTFEFVVERGTDELVMTIMDWDLGMQDDLVGTLKVPLAGLKVDSESEQTVQVLKDSVPVTGKDGMNTVVTMQLYNHGPMDEQELVPDVGSDPMHGKSGVLTVRVVEARGLPKMDAVSQKADPFLRLTVGNKIEETDTKWRTLEPVWNQTFEFDTVLGEHELVVEMFDNERFGKSRTMGKFSVPIVSKQQKLECALQGVLSNKKKTPCCGHVFLETSWGEPTAQSLPRGSVISNTGGSLGSSEIEVTVKSVNHLPKTDKLGKCDPYVVMAIDDVSHKTKAAKSVYDHTFQPDDKPYHAWSNKDRNSTVEVKIFDHDTFGRDEQVGHVDVDLAKFKKETSHTKTFEVLASDGTALFGYSRQRTTVTLEIRILGGDADADSDAEHAEDEECEVLVTARTFGNFPKMDTFGSVDPFLVLEMAEREYKTQVVKNKYDGEWNETFRFPMTGLAGKLVVRAYDWDNMKTNELIGEVKIRVHDLFVDGSELTKSYSIRDKGNNEVKNKKSNKPSVIELGFTKQARVIQQPAVSDERTRLQCREILKHRGSSCKLEVLIESASNILHSGSFYCVVSLIRADGKTDKEAKTKTANGGCHPVWKDSVMLDCEPEFLLYTDSPATLQIELVEFRNAYSLGESEIGIIKVDLVDAMFCGVQALELPVQDIKHESHILEDAKGFQTKLKLTFKPPKFLLEAAGFGHHAQNEEPGAGDLPGRVDQFCVRQKEFQVWEAEEKDQQWQALYDELNMRLDSVSADLEKHEAQRVENKTEKQSELQLQLMGAKTGVKELIDKLEGAYGSQNLFQSSQVQLFVGVIASLIQILLLKLFVIGT